MRCWGEAADVQHLGQSLASDAVKITRHTPAREMPLIVGEHEHRVTVKLITCSLSPHQWFVTRREGHAAGDLHLALFRLDAETRKKSWTKTAWRTEGWEGDLQNNTSALHQITAEQESVPIQVREETAPVDLCSADQDLQNNNHPSLAAGFSPVHHFSYGQHSLCPCSVCPSCKQGNEDRHSAFIVTE